MHGSPRVTDRRYGCAMGAPRNGTSGACLTSIWPHVRGQPESVVARPEPSIGSVRGASPVPRRDCPSQSRCVCAPAAGVDPPSSGACRCRKVAADRILANHCRRCRAGRHEGSSGSRRRPVAPHQLVSPRRVRLAVTTPDLHFGGDTKPIRAAKSCGSISRLQSSPSSASSSASEGSPLSPQEPATTIAGQPGSGRWTSRDSSAPKTDCHLRCSTRP
jgi:hypothetical protein